MIITNMQFFARSGRKTPLAKGVGCFLLAALLLQVAPFAFHQPQLTADAADSGARQYFKPLQVCGDLQVPGSLLADIPWVSTSQLASLFTPEEETFPAASSRCCPEVFPSPVYRPPRPASSLS
jgi:hypothetical protein